MNEDTTEAPAEKSALDLALEDAQAKFPKRRLYAVDSPAGILILGNPAKAQYQFYVACLYSDEAAEKAKATDVLLLACAVVPDSKSLKTMIDGDYAGLSRNPDVIRTCALAAGITKDAEAKK